MRCALNTTPKERIARIEAEIRGVAAQFGVTSWERMFLADNANRDSMTSTQESILAKIEKKVFGGDDDE